MQLLRAATAIGDQEAREMKMIIDHIRLQGEGKMSSLKAVHEGEEAFKRKEIFIKAHPPVI